MAQHELRPPLARPSLRSTLLEQRCHLAYASGCESRTISLGGLLNGLHSMHTPRILLAGLFHETHTFLEETTPWEAFDVREGNSILASKGEASPLGAVLSCADEYGWDLLPTIFATATPSATVTDDVFERFWNRFSQLASPWLQQSVDGIFLVLHGAFATHNLRDVEGELLARIRAMPGAERVPIFGVYDLHANFSEAMARHANYLTAYRENPHWDARESSTRAAAALQRCLSDGRMPTQWMASTRIIWPPTGTASNANPMKQLLTMARTMESNHADFLTVNVNGGFAFADTPDTCVSFSISSLGDEATARVALSELVATANEHAAEGLVQELPLEPVLEQLRAESLSGGIVGLTVLAEPSENIGAGAPGNGTTLLRGLLKYGIPNSAVCLWDPIAVQSLKQHDFGELVTIRMGGKASRMSEGPIEVLVNLKHFGDGLFELDDKQSHLASMCGDRFDMGDCAVVEHQGVTILLTSNRTPPMDLGQWKHVGIAPEKLSVIGVKAAVAHRRAYDPILTRHYWIETPGPCQSNLKNFDYRHVRRPIFPLD